MRLDAVCYKLLPVIETDSCNGCGKCLDACDQGCLGLVWSFATVQWPELCNGEGACAVACPDGLIYMDWVPTSGDRSD